MIPPGKYRTAWRLALLVSFLSVASAVIHGLGVQITTGAIGFLDYAKFAVNVPLGQAETIDSRQRLLEIIQLSVGLLEVLLFLMWVYRANKNGRALGAASGGLGTGHGGIDRPHLDRRARLDQERYGRLTGLQRELGAAGNGIG